MIALVVIMLGRFLYLQCFKSLFKNNFNSYVMIREEREGTQEPKISLIVKSFKPAQMDWLC